MDNHTGNRYVGIEVGKTILNVDFLPLGGARHFTHDAEGMEALVALLQEREVERIVLEAASGNETVLACTLTALGLPMAIVEPKRVRDFARARHLSVSTDKATQLALYAQKTAPPIHAVSNETQHALTNLLDRRRQLAAMRTQERARLCRVAPMARQDIEQHIVWLSKRIHKFDDDLTKCFRAAATLPALCSRGRAESLPARSAQNN